MGAACEDEGHRGALSITVLLVEELCEGASAVFNEWTSADDVPLPTDM